MKHYLYLFFTFLVLSGNVYALSPKIEIVERLNNLRMVAFIDTSELDNSPVWHPNSESPPLGVAGAIKALDMFDKDSLKTLAIREIDIRPVPRHEQHWHYLIKVTNDKMQSGYDLYVILMNGKVIPALIEPDTYK